jgi:hypothetical protein
MLIGGLLLSNYIQQKGITAEKVKSFVQDKLALVKQGALKVLGLFRLGTETSITGQKKAGLLQSSLTFVKETAINALKTAKLGIQLAYNTAVGVGNALMNTGIGGILKQAGALVMKAVGGIWSVLSMLGPIAGPIAAVAATGTLFALFNKAKSEKAGDVGIAPKGGPIVASPKEGRIFQGTNNDGVEMSPTAGQPGGEGGGTTATIRSADMKQLTDVLNQILQAVQNPPPVVVGESQVGQISSKISAAKSFIS